MEVGEPPGAIFQRRSGACGRIRGAVISAPPLTSMCPNCCAQYQPAADGEAEVPDSSTQCEHQDDAALSPASPPADLGDSPRPGTFTRLTGRRSSRRALPRSKPIAVLSMFAAVCTTLSLTTAGELLAADGAPTSPHAPPRLPSDDRLGCGHQLILTSSSRAPRLVRVHGRTLISDWSQYHLEHVQKKSERLTRRSFYTDLIPSALNLPPKQSC